MTAAAWPAPVARAQATDESAAQPKAHEGIVPLPDYSGDWAHRQFLSGDWGSTRNDLAAHGLVLNLDWTQTGQGVVGGGKRIDWDYGGSFDIAGTFDLMRAGLVPGGLVTFRIETRYGETVNDDAGTLLPVNTDGSVPLTARINDGVAAITQFSYTQFFSEKLAVMAGKVQLLDGDANEFASGRGTTQFMNFNFIENSASALTVPYSTLAAGIIFAPTKMITIATSLLNTTDSSTTTGFNHVEDGWTWGTEVNLQYKLGELPGGMNIGGVYAFAGDFSHLNGYFETRPGQGVSLSTKSETWYVYMSAWQYLYTPDKAPEKIDLTNGKADLRGIGLFTRIGVADQDTNPVNWSISGGPGGRGLIPGRDDDTWGAGYVYTELTSTRVGTLLNLRSSTQALEAFYNVALTPATGLTFDIQWVESAAQNATAATVLGVRFDARF